MFLCTPGKKEEMKLPQRGFQTSLGIHHVSRANPLLPLIKHMSQIKARHHLHLDVSTVPPRLTRNTTL